MNFVRRERKIQYIVKSYEKCKPASAASFVRRFAAGSGACVLCLCGESLLLLSESVTLKDAHTEVRPTLLQLVQQLIPAATSDDHSSYYDSTQRICKTCIKRLSGFYLFSKKCVKTAMAVQNIKKIISNERLESNKKRKTKVYLPYEDVYKYADENVFDNIELLRNNANQLQDCSEIISIDLNADRQQIYICKICKTKFKTKNEVIDHYKSMHIDVKVHSDIDLSQTQEKSFNCALCSLRNLSWHEFTEHRTIHLCEKLMRNILQNKPFCICCLRVGDNLITVSRQLFFNGLEVDANPSLTLNTIVQEIFHVSVTDTYNPALMCEICVTQTIGSYNMKKMFEHSITNIKKCINIFENNFKQASADSGKLSSYTKLNLYLDLSKHENLNILDGAHDNIKDAQEMSSNDIANSDYDGEDCAAKIVTNYKHECTKCSKTFSTKMKLYQHERIHGKSGNYYCRLCCKKYLNSKSLLSHQKKCHKSSVNESKTHLTNFHNVNALICDYCNKKHYSKESLKAHIFRKHLACTKYVCDECGKRFHSSVQYHSHKCRYKCNECFGLQCIHLKFLKALRKHQIFNPKMQHKCVDCDFLYYYKHEIIAHANKEHLFHFPHLCDICGESFAAKGDLKYHRVNKHKEILHCPHCDRVLKDQALLEKHINCCKFIYKPFKCDLCIAQFTSEDKMTFHRRKHFPRNFHCEFCQGKYWTKSELNGHLKRSHKDLVSTKNDKNKVYQCSMCSMDFCTKKERMDHISTHSLDSKHICRTCNASFKSKINYYGHLKRHNVKKDCECPVCGKFYTKYNIGTHVKCHGMKQKDRTKKKISDKNTMCDICGRLLSNQASLIKHREIHKEQEQCPHCLKFINSTVFDRHLRSHENAGISKCRTNQRSRKMFHCTQCDYSSMFSDCLEAHENRFHLQVRPFKCDVCSKGFYAKITLKEHIRTHSGTKPEQCEQCGNRFVSKKALRLHVRIHTGEKPYKCDLCEERFLSASRRQAHRTRKHFEPSVQCQLCLKMYYTQSAVRIHIRDYHSAEPRQRGNKKKRV